LKAPRSILRLTALLAVAISLGAWWLCRTPTPQSAPANSAQPATTTTDATAPTPHSPIAPPPTATDDGNGHAHSNLPGMAKAYREGLISKGEVMLGAQRMENLKPHQLRGQLIILPCLHQIGLHREGGPATNCTRFHSAFAWQRGQFIKDFLAGRFAGFHPRSAQYERARKKRFPAISQAGQDRQELVPFALRRASLRQ